MIIDLIGKNIRLVCLALFIGFAATAASMYWNLPARWKTNTAKPEATSLYSCPMHPEVTSRRPGKCGECGMSLTAATAAADAHTGCGHSGGGCGATTVATGTNSLTSTACPFHAATTHSAANDRTHH